MSKTKKTFREHASTYNYCQVCGHTPGEFDEPNRVVRWYDVDDGWKIGSLCPGCGEDHEDAVPKAGDFAVETGIVERNPIASSIDTDTDPYDIIADIEEEGENDL